MSWKLSFIISICIILICMIVSAILSAYQMKKQGKKLAKQNILKKKSKFERIVYELPYQIVKDAYNREDYEFQESGLYLITGGQGAGKTVTVVYLLQNYKELYPNVKIRTNMDYAHEDGKISDWRDLVFNNNGVHGQIEVVDEIQNWFNSNESKDFPPEMLQEVSQQRKQRKMIIGTTQVWGKVGKPIREQCKYVFKPFTIFGCLTIVGKYMPVVNKDGEVEKLKFREAFFFVHTDDIRNAYDTYKKIQAISLKGFKPYNEQIRADRYRLMEPPQAEARRA